MMRRAVWQATVIAESDDVKVVDGYAYFPVEAVNHRYLHPSDQRSICPWKGTASYYDLVVDGAVNPSAAWCYPNPSQRAEPLVGRRIAFWGGVKIEGDEEQRQRPSLFARLTGRHR